jgi:hypothetical protein
VRKVGDSPHLPHLNSKTSCEVETRKQHTTMHTRRSAGDAATASAVDAVLFSPDLWAQRLWPLLDRDSKAAMRCVSTAARAQVDACVEVVASPASGFSAQGLTHALMQWPRMRDLTLMAVSSPSVLKPLSTATLAGLTRLAVRQVGTGRMARACLHGAHACMASVAHANRIACSSSCLEAML